MLRRLFSTSRCVRGSDFTHTVIGAGAVGLAVAAEIAEKFRDSRVLVVEKNEAYGQETSSRNSEVVHGGLYYPEDSLKTRLCIAGKERLYQLKDKVPVRQCGKWVVAQSDAEIEYLEQLHAKSLRIGVPTEFLSLSQAKRQEPLVHAERGVLVSPTTGITSAHALMDYQYGRLQAAGGSVALGTEVVGIERNGSVFEIRTKDQDEDDDDDDFVISSDSVINCAGLHAPQIAAMVDPASPYKAFYAKGNYFGYTGKPLGIRRLVYPCPTPGVASLGTHLTIDLGGQIRFGPDLEWVDRCDDYKPNGHNLAAAYDQVKRYLPGIQPENLEPSYCGIRPKIIGPGQKRFQDFVIRAEPGIPGFVNLLGIESPGLTASMGIAAYVCGTIL